MWLTIRGYIAGAVAFVACPCHLPITLPLLLSLTAGTGLGVWLAGNIITVAVISTGLFIVGLALAFKWIGDTGISGLSKDVSHHLSNAPEMYAQNSVSDNSVPHVRLLTSSACASCSQAKAIWQQARERVDFQFETVDIFSEPGRDLAARHNLFSTPATVINDVTVLRGIPNLENALAALALN